MTSNLHRILLATDFSPSARLAFAEVQALARLHRAEVTLVHVVSVPSEFDGSIPLASSGHLHLLLASAEEQLAGLAKPLREAHVAHHCQVLVGDPRTEVPRLAEELKPGLIVVGTHGRTGLRHFFLGSVAETIVRTSRCPVLVVPGRMQEATASVEASASREGASITAVPCTFEPPAAGESTTFSPPFTVDETDRDILLVGDLPGVEHSSLRLSVFHGKLTVSGGRPASPLVPGARRTLDERSGGAFSRSFQVPPATAIEDVQARLLGGVLSIRVAKAAGAREAPASTVAAPAPAGAAR